MESASCELALKQYIVNTLVRGTPFFRAPPVSPGETPTFLAPGVSPGENTHILCTSVSPTSTTGFREPLYKPAWPRETPYTTVDVFPVVSVPFYPMYPARAGFPFWLRGSTSTLRTRYECGMRLTHHFISTIGRIHRHPCIRPTSILSE